MTDITIPMVASTQTDFSHEQKQEACQFPHCTLKWRQGQLLVGFSKLIKQPYLPLLEDEQWLVDCLKHSSVRLIRIDPAIGEVGLRLWADTCRQANKAAFLLLPSTKKLPRKQRLPSWRLKRVIDWIAALLILGVLSPVIVVLALVLLIASPGPILFRQWRVGNRGKLFQILKFRTMVVNAEQMHHQVMKNETGLHKCKDDPRITPMGRWMRKYSLDELPQLLNVLEGNMSLVGPRPWALYDATRLSLKGQQRLNALPGMTGPWQVGARSAQSDLDVVNQIDLEYLHSWSLGWDLKILLQTIPRVILGFGAW